LAVADAAPLIASGRISQLDLLPNPQCSKLELPRLPRFQAGYCMTTSGNRNLSHPDPSSALFVDEYDCRISRSERTVDGDDWIGK
jgi:hypothetical protein